MTLPKGAELALLCMRKLTRPQQAAVAKSQQPNTLAWKQSTAPNSAHHRLTGIASADVASSMHCALIVTCPQQPLHLTRARHVSHRAEHFTTCWQAGRREGQALQARSPLVALRLDGCLLLAKPQMLSHL